ncbi:unnamed protein product [Urochloa decumbens]|uniref:Uncharacterized protein n=1 Tax=Urochloa decumbens TaxID=240449 RepID=A0ABC9E2U6_9POAL
MAAATVVVFIPASGTGTGTGTAPLLHHHRRQKQNYSRGLGIARSSSSSSRASIRCRLRPALPSCCGYERAPLVPASDHWGNWTFLLSAAALGLWSEKSKALAGALVSVLLGLAASSAGAVAADAPAYRAALEYLLPLAVPLLLFRADLRRPFRSAGAPMLAFLLGSVATVIGTLVALRFVPMHSLGPDSSRIAVALMCRHIGGAFSYVAVCEGLGVSPSAMEAGLAAGNAIRAVYFAGLFALSAKIPAEDESESTGERSELPLATDIDNTLPVAKTAMAVAAAFSICRAGTLATSKLGQLGIEGASLPCITAVVVVAMAIVFPSGIRKLAPSDDTLAVIVMQVLFAIVGASGSIVTAINTAPSILAFAFVQVAVHLLVTLSVGRLLGFDRKLLLVASAANVGGPTSACGVAAVKGWTSLVAPAFLACIFVIAIVGVVLGALFVRFVLPVLIIIPIVNAGGAVIGLGSYILKTFVGMCFGALAVKFMFIK